MPDENGPPLLLSQNPVRASRAEVRGVGPQTLCGEHKHMGRSSHHTHASFPCMGPRGQTLTPRPGCSNAGYLVLNGFASAEECGELRQRAEVIVDEFDPDGLHSIFSTKDQVGRAHRDASRQLQSPYAQTHMGPTSNGRASPSSP